MSVALRSARALGSPQTHFRFRRFGTDHHDFTLHPGFPRRAPTKHVTGPGCGVIDCRDEADRCCRRWWIALKFWNAHLFPISSFFMPIKSAVFKCLSCFLMCTNLNDRRGYVRTLTFSGCFKVLLPYSSHPRNAFLMENRFYFLILYVDFVHWSPHWYRVITTISPVLS